METDRKQDAAHVSLSSYAIVNEPKGLKLSLLYQHLKPPEFKSFFKFWGERNPRQRHRRRRWTRYKHTIFPSQSTSQKNPEQSVIRWTTSRHNARKSHKTTDLRQKYLSTVPVDKIEHAIPQPNSSKCLPRSCHHPPRFPLHLQSCGISSPS